MKFSFSRHVMSSKVAIITDDGHKDTLMMHLELGNRVLLNVPEKEKI
jgi:hypothetical protein